MSTMSKWKIDKAEQEKFITALTADLAPLRAKISISQGELAALVGVSRQTYCAVENGKKMMSWSTFLSLILFFDYNQATHQMIRDIGAFPNELVERFNNGVRPTSYKSFMDEENNDADNVARMLKSLDERGLHTMKTVLQLEYNRCAHVMDSES